MSKYKGLFTFDVDNHRYLPVEQADGIIDCMNYYPEHEMPKEPLIKDEKIRKAVRAWAEVNNYEKCIVRVYDYDRAGICIPKGVTSFVSCEAQLGITFFGINLDIKKETPYTIAELCGDEE